MWETVYVAVTDASQVGEARRVVTRIANEVGLNETRTGETAIVVTELANNLYRYGGGGEILLRPMEGAAGGAIEIIAVDRGPGMADVAACMRDGYSTGGTPGNGLGAVKRISAEFDVFSSAGRGTVVLSRVNADGPARAGSSGQVAWGAVSRSAKGEVVCGDALRVAERVGSTAVMLADGLGHGPGAAEAAGVVADAFVGNPFSPPAKMVELAHRLASKTRGAAVAVARLDVDAGILRYCGVGNISGALLTARDSRGLFTHNGTVGHQARKVAEFEYPWPGGGLLVMHTDGLQTRWDLDDYPGLYARHPAVIAAVLARDFTRGRDDVTVLAMRLRT
jgi:anti-sigma regulatory factor (Ser/Thr protein kinase)